MKRLTLFALLSVVGLAPGCGDPFRSGASLCDERDGIRICAQDDQYPQGATVVFTISNTGSGPVFEDMCSGEVAGRSTETSPWSSVSGATRNCGPDPTLDDIIANMREVAPGQSVTTSFRMSAFAFQGDWRAQLYFLDSEGQPLSDEAYVSGVFEVFPSAGN